MLNSLDSFYKNRGGFFSSDLTLCFSLSVDREGEGKYTV
jgi:hypothetical protein